MAFGLGLGLGFGSATGGGLSVYAFNTYFASLWSPTFTVYRDANGTYSTNYNHLNDKPTGTTLYCTKTGNDTTGDGTSGNPYRTIQKCYNENADIINIGAGFWDASDAFSAGWAANRSIALDGATTGLTIISRALNAPSFSLDSGNVYVATGVTGVATVLDLTRTQSTAQETLVDGTTGVPIPFEKVSDKATCESTEYSYYDDGVDLYVHAAGGAAPNLTNVKVLSGDNLMAHTTAMDNNTLYLANIEIWGKQAVKWDASTSGEDSLLVGYKAAARYAILDNWDIDDVNTRLIECQATDSREADGFNYHRNTAYTWTTTHLEESCYGARCGYQGAGSNDNNSTTHDRIYIIRVNCSYRTSYGPNVADTAGSWAYNLNCSCTDSQDVFGTDFQCGTSSGGYEGVAFYQDCTADGTRGFAKATGGHVVLLTNNTGTTNGTIIDGTDPTNIDTLILAVNTVAPAVTGTETVGETLSCTTGTWDGLPVITYLYQWQNDGGTGTWANIAGATSSTYTLQATDEGDDIRCVVTAQIGVAVDPDAIDTTTANSNATGAIAAVSFSPDDLPELNAWFDPSNVGSVTTSGGNATVLTDLSGGTNMTANTAAAYGLRTINSLNVLDFDKGENYAVNINHTNGHEFFMVLESDDVTTANFIRSVTAGTFRSLFNTSGQINVITPSSNLTGTTVLSTATAYIIYMKASASGHEIFINGGTSDGSNVSSAGLTANLDTIGAASFGYDGAMGEFCAFEATLTTSEINQVGNYLADKWGVTWTDIT